ncbi:sodium-coupled neutral amino acid transporter 1 [Protopterus annectens]|uniref:sodium-coupled neutral amino acid transporter 1 n=1 Tax=Protopterus annectens TaxID=7888 RepID=UPI001CF98747|nr:sodium-coupled neutral amino acid transporter 1 [Protopterus annectens]
MPFSTGMDSTELQNMNSPEDDDDESNDFVEDEVSNGQISGQYMERESRRSLTTNHLDKQKCDEYDAGTTSFKMSVFNLSNAIMGSGILGLAYAVANTGIILFVFLLASVTILSVYSIHLLLKCSKETGSMVYEKLGELAFGTPGKLAVFGSTFLQNFGAILSYLFIVKMELPLIIKYLIGQPETYTAWYVDGRLFVVTITVVIILPLCLLRTLGYLGYTSGFSLACMTFFLIAVVYKKFTTHCPTLAMNTTSHNEEFNDSSNYTCEPQYFIINSKTAYALPTIAFAFVCHPSVLPIYSELKERSQQKMQKVSNVSFLAMFTMYLLTALFGYLTFYDGVHSELLYTYHDRNDTLMLIVRLAVVTAVVLTVPVLFFTIRSSLFELTKYRKFNWLSYIIVTILLLILLDLLVVFIPSIKDIFGIIGATSSNMLIFILPSSLFLKLVTRETRKIKQKIAVSAFLGLGILFSLICIPLVIYDWIYGKDAGRAD